MFFAFLQIAGCWIDFMASSLYGSPPMEDLPVMRSVFVFVLSIMASSFAPAFAQSVGDYLDLPIFSPSEENHTRWSLVGIESACRGVQEPECIAFELPAVLVGGPGRKVVLTGQAGAVGAFYTLRGDGAEATCIRSGGDVSCLIRFPDLVIDAAQVERYLAATFVDPAEQYRAGFAATSFGFDRVLRYWSGII